MKKLLLLLLLWPIFAQAADKYVCDCSASAGAYSGCVAGTSGHGTSAADPALNAADVKTAFNASNGGDRIKICRGGALNNFSATNLHGLTSSASNPIIIEAYTPSWMALTETGTATAVGSNTLTNSGASWTVNAWAGYQVRVDSGHGVIQQIKIASNTATVLTLVENWRITPSATSTYVLEAPRPILKNSNVNGIVLQLSQSSPLSIRSGYVIDSLDIIGRENPTTPSAVTGGAVVTVTSVGHGLATNDLVSIYNASTQACDKSAVITVVDADNFTYVPNGTCTGAITGVQYFKHGLWGLETTNQIWHVTVNNSKFDGFSQGIDCNGSYSGTLAEGDGSSQFYTYTNSQFFNSNGGGMLLGCSNTVIENNFFDRNGLTLSDHHIYFDDGLRPDGTAYVDDQIVVRGNTLTNGSIASPGRCAGVAIVTHGKKTRQTVENNIVREDTPPTNGGCYGIAAGPGYNMPTPSSAEYFGNVVIRGNDIINAGYVGASAEACYDCLIENNNIYSEFVGGAGCVITKTAYTSAYQSDDHSNEHVVFRNNTCYIKYGSPGGVAYRFMRNAADPVESRHEFVSNVVYFGTGVTTASICFEVTNTLTTEFAAWDNNACYGAGGVVPKWANGRGVGTLAASQAVGFDLNSLQSDPQFIAPTGPLYLINIPTTSPLKAAGHATKSARDAYGYTTRSGTSDIGAFQFGATGTGLPPPINLTVN